MTQARCARFPWAKKREDKTAVIAIEVTGMQSAFVFTCSNVVRVVTLFNPRLRWGAVRIRLS
jgi:hypothetical protein